VQQATVYGGGWAGRARSTRGPSHVFKTFPGQTATWIKLR
jgi:hypothetical protein